MWRERMRDVLFGHQVVVASKSYQVRSHRKKRINKKWRKRYGYINIDLVPDGEIMMIEGTIYMSRKTYEEFKKELRGDEE